MKTLAKYFLQGCLVLAPAVATIYVGYWVVRTIDGWLGLRWPGVGFVTTIGGITLAGYLASNLVGRRVIASLEGVFTRLPLARLVFNSVRDLLQTFVGDKKFGRPAIVTLSRETNVLALGYVSREELAHPEVAGYLAVYLPQSYNFAGFLILMPKEDVKVIEASAADFMSFIVSGGVSGRF
jgi:uncharacterized membrane protein